MEKETDQELKDIMMAANSHVQLGGLYRHKKTNDIYVARLVTLRENDLKILVSYAKLTNTTVTFTRPYEEFAAKFEKMPQPFVR